MTAVPRRLLISGVPGAGKSRFVDWLVQTQGFSALKADDGGPLFNAVWSAARSGHALALRMSLLPWMNRSLVIELGFVPDEPSVSGVLNFIAAGFDAWWFSADYPDAFHAWREAKGQTDHVQGFYLQIGKIVSHWPEIASLYREQIIHTLQGGKHMPPQEIAALIGKSQSKN